jgi:hypothetical protein
LIKSHSHFIYIDGRIESGKPGGQLRTKPLKAEFNARSVEIQGGVFCVFRGCATGTFLIVAHVAQLVEHILGKDEVNGSIPFVGLEVGNPLADQSRPGQAVRGTKISRLRRI